jgi:hypothetical protein
VTLSDARRAWVTKRKARLRELRNKYVDQQLKQLEAARRAVISGVDILLLGDSSFLFGADRDTERAMIPELIRREMGGASIAVVTGPGYNGRLYSEVLRILGTLDERPKFLVNTLAVRTNLGVHVTRHPLYCYRNSFEHLAQIRDASLPIRSLGKGHAPTPEEYDEFHALPVRTRWAGDTTIGAFRQQLKGLGPMPWTPERERVLFDYFHGEEFAPDHPLLEDVRELGRQINAYGVPTASYQIQVPIERGEVHFPGEFAALAAYNRKLIDGAVGETAGPNWHLVDPQMVLEDYAHPLDGVEHFATSGRLKIARGVAAAFRG